MGQETNLLELRQLMDSAGAGAHEMGTERHVGEVRGLEGSGGAATRDGELSRSEGVPAAESHTALPSICSRLCKNPTKALCWCVVRFT